MFYTKRDRSSDWTNVVDLGLELDLNESLDGQMILTVIGYIFTVINCESF